MRFLPFLRAKKEDRLFGFLRTLGAEETPHYQQSLLGHLKETYELLKEWDCNEYVCSAGLFHSVYGTSIFRHQSVSYDERSRIKRLIGRRAERLSFLFSIARRPQGFIDALESGRIIDARDESYIEISERDLADLITIECANLTSQGAQNTFFEKLRLAIERRPVPLPKRIISILNQ